MWTVFSLLVVFSMTDHCRPGRIDDICSTRHVKRVFSGLGESGFLTAHNVTPTNATTLGVREGCHAEIVTCPSCTISLTFSYMNLSCRCGSGFDLFFGSSSRSDYVWLTEPPYEDASGVPFCGIHPGSATRPNHLQYKSKTRTVRVSLFYTRPHFHAFTMDYKSELNRQVFVGTSRYQPGANLSTGFFSSPFFPAAYPGDLVAEYDLICKRHSASPLVDADLDCRIRLMFTDFQLAASSFMEFYEGSRHVYTVTGTSFRPPVITSSTGYLTVRFFASGHSSAGFKALFSFISDVGKEMATPATDCGGFVGNLGGTITMMNMTDSQLKLYYCIWLIQPWGNFLGVKSHLYLKVTAFLDFAGDAELQVRRGLTSESPLLESLRHPTSQNFQEHIIPLTSGYYVSLRALFGPASHFAVTYAGFSLTKCFGASEFLCRNFRCISKKLTCDGFDHCGDNSDESGLCHQARILGPGGGQWHTLAPSYHFPKITRFSASAVLLVSFVGLLLLLLALTTVVYRIAATGRRRRNLPDRSLPITDLRDSFSDEVSVEDVVIDDPPSYEPPPSYEDVIKMSLHGNPACSHSDKPEHDQ